MGESTRKLARRAPGTGKFRSLDDVMIRHTASEGSPRSAVSPDPGARSRPPPPSEEESEPAAKLPSVREIVQRVEVEGREVIPPELDPHQRSNPSMTEMLAVPDAPPPPDDWNGECRSLEDMLARFPLGDGTGQYFFTVTRTHPRVCDGMSCLGVQRKIRSNISYEEFVSIYGGGRYEIMAYGPPKRFNSRDVYATVRPPSRPLLQKPVSFTVPHDPNFGGLPPNPGSAFEDFEEEDLMTQQHHGGGFLNPRNFLQRPPGAAEAKMHETSVMAAERDAERREKMRARSEERRREESSSAVGAVKEVSGQALDLLQRQLDAANDKVTELTNIVMTRPQGNDAMAMAEMVKALRPEHDVRAARDEILQASRQLTEKHERELMGERERNSRELSQLRESFERQVTDLRDQLRRAEDRLESEKRFSAEQIKSAESRSAERVRDVEDRSDKRVSEIENRALRTVEELKNEHVRQVALLETVHQARIADLDRQNQRDLQSREQSHAVAVQAATAGKEASAITLQHEIERLRSEKAKLEDELKQKGDLGKQLAVFEKSAELLGYERPDPSAGGEEKAADWKANLASIGLNVVQQLPEIITRATEAARVRNGNAQPQQHLPQHMAPRMPAPPRAPSLPVPPGPPAVFRTEDTLGQPPSPFDHMSPAAAPIQHHAAHHVQGPHMATAETIGIAHDPMPPAQQHFMVPPEMPEQRRAPQPSDQMHAVAELPPSGQRKKAKRPVQAVPGAAPAAAPVAVAQQPTIELSNTDILTRRADLELMFNAGHAPRAMAEAVAQNFGPALPLVLPNLTPERIREAIESAPDGADSPLVRFQGQRWLREIYEILVAEIARVDAERGAA